MTFDQFRAKYDDSYEYWHGEAVPRSAATLAHGLSQAIVGCLLNEAGYIAGSSVELRIDPEAHPLPDVIATSEKIDQPYPTKAVDVVVEILSDNDHAMYLLEKCQAYESWGFEFIYVVNPESKQLFRWSESALAVTESLTTVPAAKIWEQLERLRHLR